jgi:Rrf2 family transcriptional repressor of oqxAB
MSLKQPFEARWFHVAVQALAVIAGAERACPSSAIAQDLQAHAVFLRRVLAQLARGGIVTAQEGRAGGYQLARPAEQITLAEVFQATRLGDECDEATQESCSNGRVESVLGEIVEHAEQAAVEVLGQYTLAAVIARSAGPSDDPADREGDRGETPARTRAD